MTDIKAKKCFRELFRFSLTNEVTDSSIFSSLSDEELINIYKILSYKKTAHLFYPYFAKSKIAVKENILASFKEVNDTKLLNYVKQESGIQIVSSLLNKNNIKFILMKGAETRHLFKVPTYRVSNDIDILFEGQENVDKALKILVEGARGEESLKGEHHDIVYILDKNAYVELHKSLFSNTMVKDLYSTFEDPFSNAYVDEKCPCRFHLKKPYFYTYLIGHLSVHVVGGESFLPPLMDIYTIGHSLTDSERKETEELLARSKVDKFERILRTLLDKYMANDDNLSKEEEMLEEYMLANENENNLLSYRTQYKSKLSFIFHRIWMPREALEKSYPRLKKHKWLILHYQAKRWFRALGEGKFKSSIDKANDFGKLKEDDIKDMNNVLETLGLEGKK